MNAAPVTLANDRQLQHGLHVVGLILMVWGGMVAGALLFERATHGDSGALYLLLPLIGFAAFLAGLYLVLVRKEVRLDALRACIEERKIFLGMEGSVTAYSRWLFDRVGLAVRIGDKGKKIYGIALRGTGDTAVSLGEFLERNEALTAGMRAARAAGLSFEEKREGGMSLRLTPADLAGIPVAPSPLERPWWRTPSAVALVAANLAPVLGVLAWGWHILPVMLLFWLENVIVGLFALIKILLSSGAPDDSGEGAPRAFAFAGNLFLAAFFTFHYGMFCLVHGGFIVAMFGRDGPGPHRLPPLPELPRIAFDFALSSGLLWAAIALVASHGLSFYTYYLKPRAFDDANAGKAMFEPYKRVVILHVVLLAGAFAADAFGASVAPMLLLIALKIAVDLASHRREHAVPYERELRDYMAEHGKRFVRRDVPATAMIGAQRAHASRAIIPDRNDRPLAHYLGAWRADPQAAVPPEWIARAEFRDAGGRTMVKLWSQSDRGLAAEGEFDGSLRGNAARIEFIEVRQQSQGRVRIARFTGSDAGAGHMDLNEIQHPEGNTNAMQARSLTLQRA